MTFFNKFTHFFHSLFSGDAGNVKKRSELKKIESDLRFSTPAVYKNGIVLPSVAEAFYMLYMHTKPIDDILSVTIASEDPQCSLAFAFKLLKTGFTNDQQELLNQLNYEIKKEAVLQADDAKEAYANQKKNLEKVLTVLDSSVFSQINTVIARLHQLADICRFNYVSAIRLFEPDFSTDVALDSRNIHGIPVSAIEIILLDLYYLVADFQLTNSIARAIAALIYLKSGDSVERNETTLSHLKVISYVFRHILTPQTLRSLIFLSKKDCQMELKNAVYTSSALQDYKEYLKKQHDLEYHRIQMEIQDATVSAEIKELFGDRELEILDGYNAEQNAFLLTNSADPFKWITPLQILKTFLTVYFDERITALLNDIVIEGFFNSVEYKSDFSSTVFAAIESSGRIKSFEDSFSRGGSNDISVLHSYVREASKDPDFAKKSVTMITQINTQAQQLIQNETNYLSNLAQYVTDIFEDAKVVNSTHISNIKMLLFSTRNRDNTDLLENTHAKWDIFLDIMKNYAIIRDVGVH